MQENSTQTTENEVRFTEKLKTEIRNTYNIKANILGPTACAMAMQIDLTEQRNKSKGHGHPSHGGAVIPPALRKEITEAMGPTFKPVLMFNGQGERDPCASNKVLPIYESQGHAGDATTPAMPSLEGYTGQAQIEERRRSVSGLDQPRLRATGEVITGINKKKLRTENRRQRRALQQAQTKPTLWTEYTGDAVLPQGADDKSRPAHRNSMCPAGLTLHHPAAETLLNWAEFGCPTHTGKPRSTSQMEEAIARGPHQSALTPEALEHFAAEIKEKVLSKQARVVEWEAIKDNPPTELKISGTKDLAHSGNPPQIEGISVDP
jgi:hypothetical protein